MSGRLRRRTDVIVTAVQLEHAKGLPLPAYQSDGAAGLDLTAAVPTGKPLRIAPRAWAMVPTGLVLELPAGTEGQVRPRSGLAARQGLTVLNSPGTIDSDYRGEVQVVLINLGPKAVSIARGDRIAQLVVAPVSAAQIVSGKSTRATARGAGGFGSTGVSAVKTKRSFMARQPVRPRVKAKDSKTASMPKSRKVATASVTGKKIARNSRTGRPKRGRKLIR